MPGVFLSDIFENKTSLKPIKPPTASSNGFPQTFKRDKTVKKLIYVPVSHLILAILFSDCKIEG